MNIQDASTTIHILSGIALFFLAVGETLKIREPKNFFSKYSFAAFFLCGLLSMGMFFYYMGGVFNALPNIKAIKTSHSLLPIIWSLFILAIVFFIAENINQNWQRWGGFFIFFLGLCLLFFPKTLNSQIRSEKILEHFFIALPLFLYPFLKLKIFSKNQNALKAAAIALFIASFELMLYKESETAFAPPTQTYQIENLKIPAQKNGKKTNEKNINKKSAFDKSQNSGKK